MVLQIYGPFLSQPTRAVLIFARANNIDHGRKLVKVGSMEHKQPAYLAVNPMGMVPAIDDDGFVLFESHAILRYLAATHSVPDHWYPAEAKRRALVDCILEWHHLNLREGAKNLVWQKVFAKQSLGKQMGIKLDENVAKRSEKVLKASLKFIEDNWLIGEGPFLGGAPQLSIADLSLVCEVKQLQLLDPLDYEAILGSREKIRMWVQATEDILAPHFAAVHSFLNMVAEKTQATRDAQKRQSSL